MNDTELSMRPGTSVLPSIQAMRGVAALAVLVHHLGQYAGLRFSAGWLLPGSGLLWSGVDIFFVLSGF
jgi:exopolysaccharide production protein ExoZ